jgi:hypothetical protein
MVYITNKKASLIPLLLFEFLLGDLFAWIWQPLLLTKCIHTGSSRHFTHSLKLNCIFSAKVNTLNPRLSNDSKWSTTYRLIDQNLIQINRNKKHINFLFLLLQNAKKWYTRKKFGWSLPSLFNKNLYCVHFLSRFDFNCKNPKRSPKLTGT